MREITKEEFYKRVNPLNVHPRGINDTYPYAWDWHLQNGDRSRIGQTVGYMDGVELKHRFYLEGGK